MLQQQGKAPTVAPNFSKRNSYVHKLVEKLERDTSIESRLPRKLFLSNARQNGPNDHPSPVECLYTIKGIILGKNPGLPQHLHSNTVERDPEEYVSATFMEHLHNNEDACVHKDYQCEEYANIEFLENFDATDDVESSLENVANEMTEEFLEDYSSDIGFSLTDSNITTTCIDLEVELLDEAEFLNDEMAIDDKSLRRNSLTEDGLEYLAGWISWKFKKSNPGLSSTRRETLPSYVTDHAYAIRIGTQSNSWIDRISYGGLTKPTDAVLHWVKCMENIFNATHGTEFNYRESVRTRLRDELGAHCPDVPKLIIDLYARSRVYMRCKYNKQRQENALLLRISKRIAAKRKADDSSNDVARSKTKKMKKIVL